MWLGMAHSMAPCMWHDMAQANQYVAAGTLLGCLYMRACMALYVHAGMHAYTQHEG